MFDQSFLSALSGWVFLTGIVPFIIAILQGYRPPKSSWIIWPTCDTIVAYGMYKHGALNGQMIGVVIGAWTTCTLVMIKGVPGWTQKQKLMLLAAAMGVILWQILGDSNIGIITGCGVILFGSWETFQDAWSSPEHHTGLLSRLAWSLYWVSCVLQVLAIPAWTVADATQPLTFLFIESVMMYLIFVRAPRLVKSKVWVSVRPKQDSCPSCGDEYGWNGLSCQSCGHEALIN